MFLWGSKKNLHRGLNWRRKDSNSNNSFSVTLNLLKEQKGKIFLNVFHVAGRYC